MGAFILSYIISLDYYYLIIIIKAGFLLLQSVEVEDSFNNFVLDCKPTDDFLLYDYDEEVRTATTVTQ